MAFDAPDAGPTPTLRRATPDTGRGAEVLDRVLRVIVFGPLLAVYVCWVAWIIWQGARTLVGL